MNVPAGKIVKVKLKYLFAGNISDANAFSYKSRLLKQPGVDNLDYSFYLNYPKFYNVVGTSAGRVNGETVEYSEKIVSDQNLIVNFAKK